MYSLQDQPRTTCYRKSPVLLWGLVSEETDHAAAVWGGARGITQTPPTSTTAPSLRTLSA